MTMMATMMTAMMMTTSTVMINMSESVRKSTVKTEGTKNAYNLKLKSIRKAILYEKLSFNRQFGESFLLFNFQIDSTLTFRVSSFF